MSRWPLVPRQGRRDGASPEPRGGEAYTRLVRVIAVAAVLFLIAVSAGWGSASKALGSATALTEGKGPTGATGPTAPLSHVKTRWRATVAMLPANAVTGENQVVSISSISCGSPGNCSAVGSYYDKAGHLEGLLPIEKAGHWRRGVEAVLPANAAPDPQVNLTSISCASAGNCTAVGTYIDGSEPSIYSEGVTAGLLLTERSGHWAAGVEADLPGGSGGQAILHSVSCASARNCTAVGNYYDSSPYVEDQVGLVLTETAGHWKPGLSLGSAEADINSVSCASDGGCSAVGYEGYYYSGGRNDTPSGYALVLSKKRGKWRDVPSDLGPSEGDYLGSVSCAPGGNCSATALYNISIDSSQAPAGLLLNQKAGKWVGAVRARAPKDAIDVGWGKSVYLAWISCPAPGDCLAVGSYYITDGRLKLALLTEEAGKWHRGVAAVLPRGNNYPYATAVSCSSPGNCTVVGDFGAVTEVAGRWERGVVAPAFSGSFDSLSSVSCASPGACGAVGVDSTFGGPVYGILLDSTTDPCVVPRVKGKPSHTARHSLESHNCAVGTIKHASSRTIARGHVISQRPRPGRHLPPGTKVNLEVSSGP